LTRLSIDITVPVLNEERAIEKSLITLVSYLSTHCPYDWYVTVVDNGSTDRTWAIADAYAATDARLRTIRLDRRGRGGALKAAWSTSTADVVAYMDVDLSTDLDALLPLLRPIVDDEADLSIGSRLATGARTKRSLQREIISRAYNMITRTVLGYHIRDAQCGFKAIRSNLARELIPLIEDDSWFFDTELLFLAWQRGLRINEVPVRWVEDDDSRVRIVKTALDDLKGIMRIRRNRNQNARNRSGSRGTPTHSPHPTLQEGRSVDFDRFAHDYEDAVDDSISFTGRNSAFFAGRKVEVLSEIVKSCVGALDDVTALDVGCGTGTTDRFLAPLVKGFHGVDISEEMLEKARVHVPEGTFHWYDGGKLPFLDESFDLVVAICVLHHVPVSQRFKFVSEMVRVTRSDGLVAVFEHNPMNPLTRHAVNTCDLDKGVVLLPSRETLGLLREAAHREPAQRHFLFSPFGGHLGRAVDRRLRHVPLGGQYVAWVQPDER
jgi:ubiquinone/menaquinone biosynthesis C-methylase UbiE